MIQLRKIRKNNKTKNKLELELEHLIFLVRDWKGMKKTRKYERKISDKNK